jgi:Abi-like protein
MTQIFDNLELYFSTQRLERYLLAANGKKDEAVKLYRANLEISRALHPLLGSLEVLLRNSVYLAISQHFHGDIDWIKNPKNIPSSSNNFLYNETQRAIKKAGEIKAPSSRIIAETYFGFWVGIFEKNSYKALHGSPIQAFPFIGTHKGRLEVYNKLYHAKELRNRINHNEPVIMLPGSSTVDISQLRKVHGDIYTLVGWVNRDLDNWFSSLDMLETLLVI